jgi:hypothetical protein
MYPGVPLVSFEFSDFMILAIPKSVMRANPLKYLIIFPVLLFTFLIQDQVLWFYVTMNDFVIVQVF